eukprot:765857-Prymnesium_polylepis.1
MKWGNSSCGSFDQPRPALSGAVHPTDLDSSHREIQRTKSFGGSVRPAAAAAARVSRSSAVVLSSAAVTDSRSRVLASSCWPLVNVCEIRCMFCSPFVIRPVSIGMPELGDDLPDMVITMTECAMANSPSSWVHDRPRNICGPAPPLPRFTTGIPNFSSSSVAVLTGELVPTAAAGPSSTT